MNNSEKIFHDGDHYFRDLFIEIDRAKSLIFLEIHFIDHSYLGKTLFKKLKYALFRGVQVVMIIDGLGFQKSKHKKLILDFKQSGGLISFFNPMFWNTFNGKFSYKINERTHKKSIIIDNKILYLGSFNFDTRQLSDHFGGENWRDIGLKIFCKKSIEQTELGFWNCWLYCNHRKVPYSNTISTINTPIKLNHSSNLRRRNLTFLLDRIKEAKKEIIICNPYFVPDSKFIKALIRSSENGIKIKLLVPQKSDLKLFPLINSVFYGCLLKHRIEIYEYLPSILHAKILLIDDWAQIGSSNLNSRTQKHDWEIDYIVKGTAQLKDLKARLDIDFKNSRKLSKMSIKNLHFKQFWKIPIIYAIQYWL
jgi:cardiolipin synthase